MQVALQLNMYNWPSGPTETASTLADIARTADDAGFVSMWVLDHYFQIPRNGVAEDDMHEAYNVLGYIAGLTKRMRLGTMATGVIYRHPAALVKILTTLDVLSSGRASLCIGAGWYEREALGLGLPFPPLSQRFEMLEENLQILKKMWSDDITPYEGKHYQLAEPICSPQPLSKPHPPIIVGGGGLTKTLPLAVKYGDGSNVVAHAGLEDMATRLDALKRHCDNLGRPYEDIEKSCIGTGHIQPGVSTAKDVINMCQSFADLGIQTAVLNMPNVSEIWPLEVYGREIIPAVAEF